jgi:DNA-binding SARP family transcriptional activator
VLIEAHLAEGNHSEAHRELENYRLVLRHELGLDPSGTLVDLVRQGLKHQRVDSPWPLLQ